MPLGWGSGLMTPGSGLEHLCFGKGPHLGAEFATHLLSIDCAGASLVAQMVKSPPVMQEIWVQSLGQKHPLEKGMATHSSILAWRILWTDNGVTKTRTQLSD